MSNYEICNGKINLIGMCERCGQPSQTSSGYCNRYVKFETTYGTPPESMVTAPEAKKEELWQTVNPNKPKYAMTTNLNTEAMPVNWIDIWCEIENWYGDHKKRETAEQLLIRLQKKFDIILKPKNLEA